MQRRFRDHDLRQVDHLEGVWDFVFLGDLDADKIDARTLRFTEPAAVPGCFDATPAYAGFRGVCAYRKRLRLRDGAPHRLVFDSVHHWCRICIDGERLIDHAGGFSRFEVDLVGMRAGDHELIVLVDNRINLRLCPTHLPHYDWYQYGGISRGVELHRLGDCWIDSLTITTEDYRARRIKVIIDATNAAAPRTLPLAIFVDGVQLHSESAPLQPGHQKLIRYLTLPNAELWYPHYPALHDLYVRLDDDDCRERIGIRQITIRGREIVINDRPITLVGFCRHESHPQFGHAVPEHLQLADLQVMRQMGCNFLRGTHYPQDIHLLDLCDEFGICVMSEGTGWNNTPEQLTDPAFLDAAIQNIDEMVAAAINRPSVILWGMLSDGPSDKTECRPAYARLLGRLRQLDPSRPVTYATSHFANDGCWDLADVLSIITYPGWEVGELADIPALLDSVTQSIDRAKQSTKPLLICELGAGALYGSHDWNRARWSEEYQAALLDIAVRHLFETGHRVCGIALCQFCDSRTTTASATSLIRARGYNNKGVLDEYRRPKLAYQTVKAYFTRLTARPAD